MTLNMEAMQEPDPYRTRLRWAWQSCALHARLHTRLSARGRIADERAVAQATAAAGISIRTGCFRNPGAIENSFRLTRAN
jgi:hypothetical protein